MVTQISSIEGLNNIRNNSDGDFVLTKDLDFNDDDSYDDPGNKTTYTTGSGFNPIGISSPYFTGTFDGAGHKISNLFIDRDTTDFVGLFGQVLSPASIKNLIVDNADVTGQDYAGIIIGGSTGILKNCYSSGTITGRYSIGGAVGYGEGVIYNAQSNVTVSGTSYIGGIVGLNHEGTLYYCKSQGTSTGTTYYIGGIAGDNNGTIKYSISETDTDSDNQITGSFAGRNKGTIDKCYSTGDVQSVQQGGGFVGQNQGTITNCHCTGDVERKSGTATSFAGFCGNNFDGKIIRCYSTGQTTITVGETPQFWYGFVGAETISTNYRDYANVWDKETSGSTFTKGNAEGKTTEEMKTITTYTNKYWNILTKTFQLNLSEYLAEISIN
jgi:hypothetical protein